MFKKISVLLLLCCLPSLTYAHAGHTEGGWVASFMHPFTGLDHLSMMLFIGLWAGRSGGVQRWWLPATFLLGMAGGWLMGALGLALAGLDSGIAVTLVALGVILAGQIELARRAQISSVMGFALLHGMAHGSELATLAWSSAAGLLLATALLQGIGLMIAWLLAARSRWVDRVAGAALALLGGSLLLAS